jgi:hypothetical protein
MLMGPTDPGVTSEKKVTNGGETTRYTFPDGSVAVSTVEDVPANQSSTQDSANTIKPLSISGGSCTSGSGYVSCSNRTVSYQLATYGYSFTATYEEVNGAYDKIDSAGNWNIWTAGGTYANASMRIIHSTESASYNAEARLSAQINLADGTGSLTRSLSLIVGDDSARDQWNSYY